MLLTDEIEIKRRCERNAKACDKLLSLLRLHHDNGVEEPVNIEAMQEPQTPQIDLTPVQSAPEPFQPAPGAPLAEIVQADWTARQKEIWLPPQEEKKLKIEHIQAAVAREYGISRRDILTAQRVYKIAFPRQVAMYLSRTMLGKSFPEIGRRFGGRDHTTVLHGFRKIERLAAKDKMLSDLLQSLQARLGA